MFIIFIYQLLLLHLVGCSPIFFFFDESVNIALLTNHQSTSKGLKRPNKTTKQSTQLCQQPGTRKKKTWFQTRIISSIFRILQRATFSIFFMNLPFPEILFRTSQKFKRRICSSVLGWHRTLISFQARQRYTVELSINLHKTPSCFFVFHFLQASSSTPCQSRRGCCMK